jgi:phage tail-like protein
MAKFTVNPNRFDPYKNFKFRVSFGGGTYVAGVSKVSALKRTTELIQHREGGDPSSNHKTPGRTNYDAITMERGVTHDPEFEIWANKVWNFDNAQAAADQRTQEVSLKDFRRNLNIDVFNEAGQKVLSYQVFRAWVSEFTAQADLDANANAVLIQSIKIEHEGWRRDPSVVEPAEPQFDGVVV